MSNTPKSGLTALNQTLLREEAKLFAEIESTYGEHSLFGVTDGKKIGTYLEHKFKVQLNKKYYFNQGNSANGIDFPDIEVDMKVTSITQPQSSSPFTSARQKIYGLGYNLLIFVYSKADDAAKRTAILEMQHIIFVDKKKTSDFQTTSGIANILTNQGNSDDLFAFLSDRNLPMDDLSKIQLCNEIINDPPEIGYLTISNALQWRLQYQRVIDKAGIIEGIYKI